MALTAQNLSLAVNGRPHLDNVSFNLARGGLYTVIGRTLAGKTTLLRAIAGLEAVDAGSLTLDGRDFLRLPVWKRGVAMGNQDLTREGGEEGRLAMAG